MNAIQYVAFRDELEKIAKKIPNWARKYVEMKGKKTLMVKRWPKDPALQARLEMLTSGRSGQGLYNPKGHFKRKPGSGKPKGGWPKGSMMDVWRRRAGRV